MTKEGGKRYLLFNSFLNSKKRTPNYMELVKGDEETIIDLSEE